MRIMTSLSSHEGMMIPSYDLQQEALQEAADVPELQIVPDTMTQDIQTL